MRYLTGSEAQDAIKWMNSAGKVAEMALCTRDKCGAVIVSGGKIIGEGYSAPPGDDLNQATCSADRLSIGRPKSDKTCCMHAEWRAIIDTLKKKPADIVGSTIYFTRVDEKGVLLKSGKPYCTVCSRLSLDVGIAEFVLWHKEGICSYSTDEYNRLSFQYKE